MAKLTKPPQSQFAPQLSGETLRPCNVSKSWSHFPVFISKESVRESSSVHKNTLKNHKGGQESKWSFDFCSCVCILQSLWVRWCFFSILLSLHREGFCLTAEEQLALRGFC